ELPGHEGRLVGEEDAHVLAGAKTILADEQVGLLELPQEGLVAQVVHLRELAQSVDRDDDAGSELARVFAPDELARVVRHDVEPHRPPVPLPCGPARRKPMRFAPFAAAMRVSSETPQRAPAISWSAIAVARERERSPRISAAIARVTSRPSLVS